MASDTKKTTASAVSGLTAIGSEDEQQKFAEVQRLQQELKDALDYRKGFYLDPTMLALAQGFAAPTRTGSFFESLGTVAGQLGQVQEAERKRAQEIAQMRLELAMGELGLQQQQRQAKETSEYLGSGRLPGMPAAAGTPGAPAGAPSGEATPATAAQVPTPGVAPANSRPITPDVIERVRITNPRLAETMERMVKSERDRYSISMQGIVFDKDAAKYLNLPIPGQKQEQYDTPFGRYLMTPYEYDELRNAITQGKGEEWMQNWKSGAGAAAVPVGKPGQAPGKPAGRMSVTEAEAERKRAETEAEETSKAQVKRTQAAIEGGSAAADRLPTYTSIEQFASDPDANRIFGILATPKASSALLKLIQSKIQLPFGVSISIPEIENAIRDLGIPPALIAKAQSAAALMANAQLMSSKINQGQGAVSDFERRLFGTSSFSMSDRPEALIYKAKRFAAAARADKLVADALLDNPGMSIDKFRRTEEYKAIKDTFESELKALDASFGGPGGSPRPAPAPSGGAASAPAAGAPSPLRQRLGLPPR